jgi:uncharacterized membrane protein
MLPKTTAKKHARNLTWRQPLVCAITTIICTALAIWAVVDAPVSSQVPGVSGLYIAAAVYVPVALWFGVWGCVAGYLSCLFMGLYVWMPWDFLFIWSLADFFEGFIPLMIYRKLKIKPAAQLEHPKVTFGLTAILIANVVVSAFALVNSLSEVFIATFIAGIVILLVQAAFEDKKMWRTWLVVGVLLASVVSGVFGVGALLVFGDIPVELFSTVFFGWVFGDIIVLSTIGTALTVALTPYIQKTRIYVRNFFS